MNAGLLRFVVVVLLLWAGSVRAQPPATVLHIASERVTDLALGYAPFVQAARLGFGTTQQPWHAWFGGGSDVRLLVHLPGYRPGQPVRIQSSMLIGNGFKGQAWDSAFAALASFDADGNGIIEGRELRDLYVWVDFEGDGLLAKREDALRPASFYYAGFDLRAGAKVRKGHAREARWIAFSVLVPYASRIHLVELDVSATYATRHEATLGATLTGQPRFSLAPSPFNGQWRWKMTHPERWKDPYRPWGDEAGGHLLLAASADRLHGMVHMVGPHEDRIKLPLDGTWREGRAQWTTVSPLGLTRSEVRLESLYGYPILRGRSWSNRNGKVSEWTWEARHEQALD